MKSLYLKQIINFFGPWESFDFNEKTPEEIIKTFKTKAGHPFQMILDYKMDCKIVNDFTQFEWLEYFYGENPRLKSYVIENTINPYNLDEINFDKYDFVYTDDPFLSKELLRKNKNTVFGWLASEHWGSNNKNYLYYDIFFDHQKKRHNFANNRKLISFPRSINNMRNIFNISDKKFIFLDNRSILSENFNSELNKFSKLKFIKKSKKSESSFYFDPEETGKESFNYFNNLATSKYVISNSFRHGQLFMDGASLGAICIGNNSKYSNLLPIHPLCQVDQESAILALIYEIENDKKLENKILNHQDKVLNNTNNIFRSAIASNLKNKKKASFKFILFFRRLNLNILDSIFHITKNVYLKLKMFKENKI